jgi:mono/diheme cytochrome c family protein
MQRIVPRIVPRVLICFGLLSSSSFFLQAQGDSATLYKARCALCHAADGSGDSPSGKAMKAKDLRSDETQKETDAELTEVISKGRGKMPVFAQKLKPEQIQQLVAYVRQLGKK